MIFDPQSYKLIFHDAVYSLGVGFLAGFINQVLAVFLYKGRLKVFVRDAVMGAVFALLIFSYSVSFANYKVLRWYNAAIALAGAALFSPCFDYLGNSLLGLAAIGGKYLLKRSKRKILEKRAANIEKKQKITQKKQQETLQQPDDVLYN